MTENGYFEHMDKVIIKKTGQRGTVIDRYRSGQWASNREVDVENGTRWTHREYHPDSALELVTE